MVLVRFSTGGRVRLIVRYDEVVQRLGIYLIANETQSQHFIGGYLNTTLCVAFYYDTQAVPD